MREGDSPQGFLLPFPHQGGIRGGAHTPCENMREGCEKACEKDARRVNVLLPRRPQRDGCVAWTVGRIPRHGSFRQQTAAAWPPRGELLTAFAHLTFLLRILSGHSCLRLR